MCHRPFAVGVWEMVPQNSVDFPSIWEWEGYTSLTKLCVFLEVLEEPTSFLSLDSGKAE